MSVSRRFPRGLCINPVAVPSPDALYTMQDIRTLLNSYITSQNLVNPNVQAYINIDPLLSECINAEGQQKKKRNSMSEEPNLLGDYMKRDELLKKVIEKMQDWYEISRDGEVSQKCGVFRVIVMVLMICLRKGSLKPISVVVKVRQGRKASTLITGFEPFLTVDAETIADDLRKSCASATSGEYGMRRYWPVGLIDWQFHPSQANKPATKSCYRESKRKRQQIILQAVACQSGGLKYRMRSVAASGSSCGRPSGVVGPVTRRSLVTSNRVTSLHLHAASNIRKVFSGAPTSAQEE